MQRAVGLLLLLACLSLAADGSTTRLDSANNIAASKPLGETLAASLRSGGDNESASTSVPLSPPPPAPPAAPATDTPASDSQHQPEQEAPAADPHALKHRDGAQEFTFQAEVNRLMDILIHSLYSNKDIFLRELISNACDALDKIRFLSLTDQSILGEGDQSKLEVQISLDKPNRMLYIRDRGIGMTKQELVKNLGTIAKSGTSAFLEQMQKGGDINLIGQFGVGFYSVYLVADWVEVVSKHNDDKQYIWSSTADGSFSIAEDTENEPLGRGTLIKIHLRPDTLEYVEDYKIKELVLKYSEFMNFPIYFQTEKEVEVPVEEEAEAEEEETEAAPEGDASVEAAGEQAAEGEEAAKAEGDDEGVADEEGEEEEEEDDDDAPATRKEKRLVWELVNDNKAIWQRKPAEVTEEEYKKFYKAVSKNYDEPLTWNHFKAEGDIEFKTVMYIPTNAPPSFYDTYYNQEAQSSLKLYVRRVFISDTIADMLPRFLSFVRGIVDSDTLPLNVSREMLQQMAALKTIKKKLVRKVLDMIKKMADDERVCQEEEEEKERQAKEEQEAAQAQAQAEDGSEANETDAKGTAEEEAKEDRAAKPSEAECKKYGTFWGSFGKAIKLGIIEDATNRNRLAKLLRFHTSKSTDKLVGLDDYVARMKEGQKEIYFLTGRSIDETKRSPFVERLLKKGYEVIFFTDVLDEYMMGYLMEYDDKKFADASKEDLKMSDKDEKERKRDKELKEEFKNLTKWWKSKLGDDAVSRVQVSNRLSTTPCVVVAGKYGQSANMERIQRAQALNDAARAAMAKAQRILEINPRHPLIKGLKERVAADEEDAAAVTAAQLLWEAALLESGFALEDTQAFSRRVYELAKERVGVEQALDAVEEETDEPEEEEASVEDEPDEYEDVADDKGHEGAQEEATEDAPGEEAETMGEAAEVEGAPVEAKEEL